MWFLLSVRNLFRNPRRSLAILSAVALGTGALFAFDGFIHGVLGELRETTIHSHYGFGQIHTKGYRDAAFEEPTKHWISDSEAIEEWISELDGVTDVFPRVSFSALLKHGSSTIGGSGQGIEAARESTFFYGLNVEEGEPLTIEPHGIVLGKGLAKALHAGPGDEITVMATSTKGVLSKDKFVVTGIFHTGSMEFDRRMFRIQLPAAQKLLKTSRIESIALGLRSFADWADVATAIEAEIPELEATPFHVLDKVYYQHSVDWLNAQFSVVRVIILSMVLLGIFNSISASVLERRQEIGNLRANGESMWQVLRLIFSEGALLGFFGSIAGMAIVYGVLMLFVHQGLLMPPGPGQTRQFLVTFAFEWPMILGTLALSGGAAVIASGLAGMKVVRAPIADLLRSS